MSDCSVTLANIMSHNDAVGSTRKRGRERLPTGGMIGAAGLGVSILTGSGTYGTIATVLGQKVSKSMAWDDMMRRPDASGLQAQIDKQHKDWLKRKKKYDADQKNKRIKEKRKTPRKDKGGKKKKKKVWYKDPNRQPGDDLDWHTDEEDVEDFEHPAFDDANFGDYLKAYLRAHDMGRYRRVRAAWHAKHKNARKTWKRIKW
jgi:hypothetical protein